MSVPLTCGRLDRHPDQCEKLVRLQVGHFVRTKQSTGRFWRITRVFVPKAGTRVLELEGGRLWIGVAQVDEVLA